MQTLLYTSYTTYNTVLYNFSFLYTQSKEKMITIIWRLITKTRRTTNIIYNTNTINTMATEKI